MKKIKPMTKVSQGGAKAQPTQNGVVSSENTAIKVELFEKGNSSTIVNDD